MNKKNIKVIDENNIDRSANVVFAFDLSGSEYVVYWIERDEESNNVFVSKVIKNIDNTFNLADIESVDEKESVSKVVKDLISKSVSDEADKLVGDSVTLSDGKTVKFIAVTFNKEQKFSIKKTYITTVKKEVTRVSENYYDVIVEVQTPKITEDIFPSIEPVASTVSVDELVFPEPIPTPSPVVEPMNEPSVLSNESPVIVNEPVVNNINTSGSVVTESKVVESVPSSVGSVVEPITVATPTVSVPTVDSVLTSPVVPEPTPVVEQPTVVVPQPEPAKVVEEVVQPLVFNATKETNLNAALGEVASSATIPVENIEPVREFGVETPVSQPQAIPQPVVNPVGVNNTGNVGNASVLPPSKSSGFANSKFFMFVAIAFFLASCVFLGYEVFNYFQLTK